MIELEHVSKRYRLKRTGAGALRQTLRRIAGRAPGSAEHWALRDINLVVPQGTSLALLGVNGSGKSTLLRIISGVTRPTSGAVRVAGRVGGVVDLGAGFHGDLTGYENIFLHGTLLGLSRADIRRRLEAIADFAELGAFLNSPVRHYSWGMFLRLGFAIAVHADPDVLVVDEALAVGDGYFQWKCLRRIDEMRREGRTLLFVSHAPDAAEAVCERAAWIDQGVVRSEGPSGDVVEQYHRFLFGSLLDSEPMNASSDVAALAPQARIGTGEALIRGLRFLDSSGRAGRVLTAGEEAVIELDVEARRELRGVSVGYVIERAGAAVTVAYSDEHGWTCDLPPGQSTVRIRFPTLRLRAGHYYLSVALKGKRPAPDSRAPRPTYDCHIKLYTFTVVEAERRRLSSARAGDSGFAGGAAMTVPVAHAAPVAGYSPRFFDLPARVEFAVEE